MNDEKLANHKSEKLQFSDNMNDDYKDRCNECTARMNVSNKYRNDL